LRRRITGFWQPSRPVFARSYVAGEYAAKVIAAERGVATAMERHLQTELSAPLSSFAIQRDAVLFVRVGRTNARMFRWLRLYLHRRLGHRAPSAIHNAIYAALSAHRKALISEPWRRTDFKDRLRLRRVRPKISGFARLWWNATERPWPQGRRTLPSDF
jgi:hypothetical protein